jgi:hypothetical protein
MNSPHASRQETFGRRRLFSAGVAGLALALALPSAAIASSVANPSTHQKTTANHHHGGTDPSNVELFGTVVSVGAGSFVVQDSNGFWRTIVLESTTTYAEGPMKMAPAATATDIADGVMVQVSGTVDANHTSLDAATVHIQLSVVRGTVQTATASTLVLTVPQSSTPATVDVNPQTVVFTHGGVVTQASAAPGTVVEAFGLSQPDGSLLALYLGVGVGHQGFDHSSDYGFSVPNRGGPNHFRGFGHKH